MQKHLFLLLLLTLFFSQISAQENLPIIHAKSPKTTLIEDGLPPLSWYLSPEAKPDEYYLSKSLNTKEIALLTDMDSIRVMLNPGKQFDFIVLLNGKDTCYNRFIYKAPITKYFSKRPITHDTIPFQLTKTSNANFPVILNGKDTLILMFDSNTGQLTLKQDAIINKTSLLPKNGENDQYNFRNLPSKNTVQMGGLKWQNQQISTTRLSGHGTDGRFGWDFFDGRVIEIDYEKEVFIVHSLLPDIPEGYSEFKMTFTRDFFHIEGDLVINGKRIKSRFLVDSGYNRAILLDPNLMEMNGFPEDIEVYKTLELRNGQGEVFVTKIFKSDKIVFNQLELENIPTQILPENLPNPSGMYTHTLGNELLKRFNTIIDLQNNVMYLKLNSLKSEPYTDES
jgi:hypothetical protein